MLMQNGIHVHANSKLVLADRFHIIVHGCVTYIHCMSDYKWACDHYCILSILFEPTVIYTNQLIHARSHTHKINYKS